MNYKQLRKEAIKTAVDLTNAILEKSEQKIELETFKLNHIIADMLEKIKEQNDDTQPANNKSIQYNSRG